MSNKSFTARYRSHDVWPETSHRTVTLFFPSSVHVRAIKLAFHFMCVTFYVDFFSTYLLSYVQALCLGCYFTLTWMAVRFARRVYSSDYIDHLSFENSWRGELAYADHYWPYCSDFTVCDFLQSWVCAWKAWFQDAKITAQRPEKTWAVI